MIQTRDEVFVKTKKFLQAAITLAELDTWVMDNIESFLPSDTAGADLAWHVQTWVAEMNRGHRDESEIRALIREFLQQHEAIILPKVETGRFGAKNEQYTERITVGPMVRSSSHISI